jgi:arsenate reductase
MGSKKEKVLFLCNRNAARSQMAEGLLRSAYGEFYDVHSAGNRPSTLSPYAVAVMREICVDISNQRSKSLKEFEGSKFHHVVTVCGGEGESCPVFPGGNNYIHRAFEDPGAFEGTEEEKTEFFRKVRDEMRVWIEAKFKVEATFKK